MSEETNQDDTRQRKAGIKRGVRTQRTATFRIDNDIMDWLQTKGNKGRFVNETLRSRMEFETTMS